MPKRVDHPIILGIVGDFGVGQIDAVGGRRPDFGRGALHRDLHRRLSPLRPESARRGGPVGDRPARQLSRHSRATSPPVARRRTDPEAGLRSSARHASSRAEYVRPKEFVIAEGLLGYTTRTMRDCYDVKIYLDPQEELRVKWKMHRDTTNRGYSARRGPVPAGAARDRRANYMHPQRTFADIVIRFQTPGRRQRLGYQARCAAYPAADFASPRLHPAVRRLEQCWAASGARPRPRRQACRRT